MQNQGSLETNRSLAPDAPWNLGRTYRRIIEEVADVVLPDEGRTPAVKSYVVRYIDGWVPHLPAMFRWSFPLGLLLVQWGTVPMTGTPEPFTLAARRKRARYLRRWEASRLPVFRALIAGLRGLILSAYYTLPSVARSVGYSPEAHVAACKRRHGEIMARRGAARHFTASMIFEDIGRTLGAGYVCHPG